MNLEKRVALNVEKGYIYVGVIDGEELWKKFDGISTVYYRDCGWEEILPNMEYYYE